MGSKFGRRGGGIQLPDLRPALYSCISVMGAIARESSRGWMTFSILWG